VLEFALPNMTGEPVRAILVYMRMTSFRRLLLCWMIAWLPISGAMAAAMPFGGTVASIAPSDAAVMDESPAAMPCHDGDAVTSGACDHCELCHIASSMIPPSLAAIDAHAMHDLPVSFPRDDFISHIPEQPQRPPLSAGA
jgi:hypothetical protein